MEDWEGGLDGTAYSGNLVSEDILFISRIDLKEV